MNASVHRQLARRKRRILRRIGHQPGAERPEPMMAASNIHYEIAEKVRGIAPGGIGAIHLLTRKVPVHGSRVTRLQQEGPPLWWPWPSSPVEWRGSEAVAEPERAEYLHSFPPRKRPSFRAGHIGLSAFL